MIERHVDGPVVVLEMRHGKVNALDAELLGALEAELDEVEGSAGAVVLTGAGRAFSAGVDLRRVLEAGDAYVDELIGTLGTGLRRLFAYPRPVVAAVNGHAIAGGFVLLAACDVKVAADGDASLSLAELKVGVPFPAAALEILRFALPDGILQSLVLAGRSLGVSEAVSLGFVDEVVPADRLRERAVEVARSLAEVRPGVYAATKRRLRREALDRIESSSDAEVLATWKAPETRRAIEAVLAGLARK